jgi:hypothetical protein
MQVNRVQMVAWILIGASACGCAVAAETLPPSLRVCMSESDATRRLACFDRESARLEQQSTPVARQVDPPASARAPAAAPAAAPVEAASIPAAAPAQSSEDKFGYRGSIARATLDKQTEEERKGFEQLTAKVAELSTLPRGELVLTLDNGQVWQQRPGDRGMRIKVGDEVTIKPASLRSFLLTSAASKGSMRVTRVK